jgi:hypothetical protein
MEWRKNYWRWLLSSPAKRHEFAKLELPGAWEPLDNSGPLPNGKGKETQHFVLMETKCPKRKMEGIRVKLGYNGMFMVELVGRSGGLALLWRETQELEIQNFTRRHINAIVKEADREVSWKLTCFYGHSVAAKRHESWALLEHLKPY